MRGGPPADSFRGTWVAPTGCVSSGGCRGVRVIGDVGGVFWFRDFVGGFRGVGGLWAIFGGSGGFRLSEYERIVCRFGARDLGVPGVWFVSRNI